MASNKSNPKSPSRDGDGEKGGSGGSDVPMFHNKYKDEDTTDRRESHYHNIQKSDVLLDCRVFHDPTQVTGNPRKCTILITKLLYLLVKGDSFTPTEIVDVFFGVTKLFQSDDVGLRRMVYLFIKEIAETCNPDDVIMVTSSLTKDMNTGEDLFRANAMRVLAKIIDATMLGAIERYLKQAIVDRNSFVASSALISGLRLFNTCPDVVRRWINEVQESVNSSSDMVQYHSLSLLYKIKQHDRLAISKIVQQLSKGSLRSPLATCLLIRYTSELMIEGQTAQNARIAYQFLDNCLRHRSEMVIYEASKAICNLPNVEASDLAPAITVLQLFLSSPKTSLKFAAMRTLNEIAAKHPISVAKCNDDMENLVQDANRSVATLAITTLLKTGSESSIERLMKQISNFMSEIVDEFKIEVVKAIRELCVKYPQKHSFLIRQLSNFLRDEGLFGFKQSIVNSIIHLMTIIPETKEQSLMYLCEFIEDCEYPDLIIQILDVVGTLGPISSAPSRYIRYVFNRMILESAKIRAAAISTLTNFATRIPELRGSILLLLKRSLSDSNNEVRDRASISIALLENVSDENELKYLLVEPMPMSFTALERSLQAYSARPNAFSDKALVSFTALPVVEEAYVPPQSLPSKGTKKAKSVVAASAVEETADPAAAIYNIPKFSSYGRAFKSTVTTPLTEAEMEYVVSYVKHVFDKHIVLQFSITNTINDQKLKEVVVNVESSDDSVLTVDQVISAPFARYGEAATCYVSLRQESGSREAINFSCNLQFKVVEVNPTTGEVEGDEDGYDEEYPLESFAVETHDYMRKVTVGDFRRSWEAVGSDGEVLEKYGLPFKKLEEAMNNVVDSLGMQPVDGTGNASAIDLTKRVHTLHLSGVFLGNVHVLARAMLQLDDAEGVVLKLGVRSEDVNISRIVADCIN